MNSKFNFNKITLAIAVIASMSLIGCTMVSNSDSLGIGSSDSVSSMTTSYGEEYQVARVALREGKFTELVTKLNAPYKDMTQDEVKDKLINGFSALSLAEKGLLFLNSGDLKDALVYFDVTEQKMGKVEDYDSSEKNGSYVKLAGSLLTGSDEISDYELRGYEKVMVLNYKALTYLLMGDRASYNATRNAIDRQIAERDYWEKEKLALEESEKKEAEEAGKKDDSDLSAQILSMFTGKVSDYAKNSASQVRSAFVNPFGDYLNAMIMEFDSLDDPSIGDNAIKAYSEVLKSNPDCKPAADASKSIEPEKNSRLVHVIWSDGFAPAKATAIMPVPFVKLKDGSALPYKYSTFEPINSQVADAKVTVGKKEEKLYTLSKVEPLLFKDEQDSVNWRVTQMLSFVARSAVVGPDVAALGQNPDTRSWLSLPKEVKVARLYVPKDTKEITIETFDANGKVIASKKTPLADVGPTIVYAVSYDQQLVTYSNKSSWITK